MVRVYLVLLRQRHVYNATYRCLSSAETPGLIYRILKLMGLVTLVASESPPLNSRCILQAWPTIIDDFVRWKNAQASQPAEAEADNDS